MFAIYLTVPFVLLALAIAAVPFWRNSTFRALSAAHPPANPRSAQQPHDRVAA
jgi:hypothetical protein